MNAKTILAIGNTLGFAGVIVVNFLANALPINGMNTGEISDLYPSLFTPSGITFSIWSVIYLSLSVFVIYQWKLREKDYFVTLSKWFILSCLCNICWILVWHNLLPAVSVIVMLVFLGVLIKLFLLVHETHLASRKDYFLVRFPFTLYLSWICVATIANIAAWLTTYDIVNSITTQEILTVVMMLVASVLAIVIALRFKDYAFPAVTVWALTGIALKGISVITPAAIAIAIALLGVTLFKIARAETKTFS